MLNMCDEHVDDVLLLTCTCTHIHTHIHTLYMYMYIHCRYSKFTMCFSCIRGSLKVSLNYTAVSPASLKPVFFCWVQWICCACRSLICLDFKIWWLTCMCYCISWILTTLNCSCTGYLARAEQYKPHPWIVPAPCVCTIVLVGVAPCSIVQLSE